MKELKSINVATLGEAPTSRRRISYPLLERYCIAPVSRWKQRLPRIIVEGLTDVFAYPIYVYGIENLDTTQKLTMEGKKIVMFSNHLSWADPPVTMAALKRNGFAEMAEMITTIAGVKLHTDPVRNFLGAPYDVIPIWSPFTEPKNQEEKEIRLQMHKKALRKAEETLKIGRHLLAYPEATRSRTQKLTIGQPGITHYLTLVENTFVLPIGIYGTEKILPVGTWLPNGNKASVTFGEPIEVASVEKMFEHIKNREERRRLIVDYFMYRIANCLPKNSQGVYERVYEHAA